MEAPAYHHIETDTGTRDSITWEFDGIRMGHAISKFRTLTEFTAASTATDVVRLHLGLSGNYSFRHRQLDTTFDLIGGHRGKDAPVRLRGPPKPQAPTNRILRKSAS